MNQSMDNNSELWFDKEYPRDGEINYYVWVELSSGK